MCKYEVKCKCGHVGRNNYIVVAFAVKAVDGKEAAAKARNLPRVKHDQKYAIISVRKITDEEYAELVEINCNDTYLQCTNIQEQNQLDLSGRIIREHYDEDLYEYREEKRYYYRKIVVRNPKKYFKNNRFMDNYMEEYTW